MALDAPAMAYGSLPPANLAAARQHVQALSARDREALLRALLEQYEHPQGRSRESQGLPQGPLVTAIHSTRSSSSTTTGSISAFTSSLFDCPPLREEAEEDLAALSATDLRPTSSMSPTDPSRWTAPSPTYSQRLRSQSLSVTTAQPLRSSYSTSQLQQAANHGRSRSLSSTSDVPLPLQLPSTKVQTKTSTSTGTTTTMNTKPKAKPVLRIKTSAADFQDTEPTSTTATKSHSYWCTACGEKLGDRTAWVLHDVACRGKERRLAREEDDSRDLHGDAAGRSHTCTQRAWACGFCAAFLGSLERYQSHVAGHFERGRTLGHWHFANVIYGLLHQPAVHKPWKRLWAARATALPVHLRPKATWSPGCCLLGREATDEPMTLQEALELFDPSHNSASALALQADALAIYISVPVDEEAQKKQKKQKKHAQTQKLELTQTKRRVEKTMAQEIPLAKETFVQQLESPPSPAPSTTNLLPAPESALAPSPPSPNRSIQTKDAPLPALPSFSTLLPPSSQSMSSSSPLDSSKKDVKRGSKLSPRKPLFLFRSRSPSSSPESATDKTGSAMKETPARQRDRKPSAPAAKLSKPRRVVSTPTMSASTIPNPKANASTTTTATTRTTATTVTARTTATTSSNTNPPRRNNWADRPLPPLVMDEFGVLSNRATSATPPIIYTRMAAGFATDQPPKPPPKPRAYTAADTMSDWNSIATTIVDDIMGPVNALHITV